MQKIVCFFTPSNTIKGGPDDASLAFDLVAAVTGSGLVVEEDVFTAGGIGFLMICGGGFDGNRGEFVECNVGIPCLSGGLTPSSEEGIESEFVMSTRIEIDRYISPVVFYFVGFCENAGVSLELVHVEQGSHGPFHVLGFHAGLETVFGVLLHVHFGGVGGVCACI